MDETMKKLLKLLLEQEDGSTEAGQKRPNSRNTAPSDSSGDISMAKKDMELANRSRQVSLDMSKTQHASHETHVENTFDLKKVPIWEKYALTVTEAVEYFHIGEYKLREIIHRDKYAPYLLWNGRKVYFKRKLFEEYLNRETEL